MKVSIERKRPMIKKLFGGTKEADYESGLVTIHFSEEEKAIIKQNRLEDRLVYEHPEDESDYEEVSKPQWRIPIVTPANTHPQGTSSRALLATFFRGQPKKFTLAWIPPYGLPRYKRPSRTIFES